MRPHEIFAAMTPEQAEAFFGRLAEKSPAMFTQSVHAAALTMKARPHFLMKQPIAKRIAAVRRSLSRVASGVIAEEILAVYFLECRKEILTDWLDTIGLEHEEGVLKADAPPCPDPTTLEKAVSVFRGRDDDADRMLLLRAFAAQRAIDWPALDELIKA